MKQICFISVLFQFYFTCKSRFRLIIAQIAENKMPNQLSVNEAIKLYNDTL